MFVPIPRIYPLNLRCYKYKIHSANDINSNTPFKEIKK